MSNHHFDLPRRAPMPIDCDPDDVTSTIEIRRATYGVLPMCRKCAEKCKNYNAPGLTRLVCPKTPDYADEARRMGAE